MLLLQAQDKQAHLCVSPQIIAELYATITNPHRVSPAFTSSDALDAVISVTDNLTMLPVPIDVTQRWIELLRDHPITGRDVFDAQLVATMLGNDVRRIYTFNRRDFEQFAGLEVLTP